MGYSLLMSSERRNEMTDATLQMFREIAGSMNLEKKDWAICRRIGGRLFVQSFGYTKERAENGAKFYKAVPR